jgi:PTS system nitrogen regulatory IIA component
MQIKEFLSASNVAIDVRASDKSGLLRELAARAASADLPVGAVASAIEKRDELGSTSIGGGAAMPHARMREVDKPFGVLARLANPVGFHAIDGQPVDIVFLLLLPASAQLEQINALAAAAASSGTQVLRKLRGAPLPPSCTGHGTTSAPGPGDMTAGAAAGASFTFMKPRFRLHGIYMPRRA